MKHTHHYQFTLIEAIRKFFLERNFTDVLTPPLVENPGMETHVHPFSICSIKSPPVQVKKYLHTSPEFMMKRLLSEGLKNIFTICYCMRDEPLSPIHRDQFLMLEWYRSDARYEKIMEDVEELVRFCVDYLHFKNVPILSQSKTIHFEKITMEELFKKILQINILDFLETKDLYQLIKINYPEIPLPTTPLPWDDYFFLLFLNKIEPKLSQYPFLILYEYPAPLAALSTLKLSDPRVCERFEVFIKGIELANCYQELTNLKIQQERFQKQNQEKKQIYGYDLPEPKTLFCALDKGISNCSGIALGIERLLTSLTKIENPFFD